MQNSSSSSSSGPALSLLTPIGYRSGDCGYCKNEESSQRTPNSRASYYARAKSLCPEHYQELMDRGWRRSGTLLYIPDASRSCCPHYTIRLPAAEFKPTRDQRQALNRWNRYVLGEKYISDANAKFPKSKEEKRLLNNSFDIAAAVHESETSRLKPGLEPAHRFEVTLEADDFNEEKFALFHNYQRNVHHERDGEISRSGFRGFLCSSSIDRRNGGGGGGGGGSSDRKLLGTYHQCYRLDGRLIAMSVLDLLPHAVSGVYFLYHSDFEKWSFGKLSALREAVLALEEDYRFYYMGYYIHSCKKMRYKGDYKPQHVLDFDTLAWYPLDDKMRDLMERSKYACMSRERALLSRLEHLETDIVSSRDEGDPSSESKVLAHASEEEVLHPSPLEAMRSELSLLQLRVPGVASLTQLRQEVDLDRMRVHIGRGGVHEMREIQSWSSGSELDPSSLKGIFAEFAAALGPVVAREAIVDFR